MFSNKALKKMIIPLVIEQILVMMVGMVDTAMVSHVGEAAISGVSLVDMINNLIIFLLAAIATGGAVIVSQYIGKGDKEETNLSACQLITISLLISVVLMVLCLVFHRPLLQLIFGSVEAESWKHPLPILSSVRYRCRFLVSTMPAVHYIDLWEKQRS